MIALHVSVMCIFCTKHLFHIYIQLICFTIGVLIYRDICHFSICGSTSDFLHNKFFHITSQRCLYSSFLVIIVFLTQQQYTIKSTTTTVN